MSLTQSVEGLNRIKEIILSLPVFKLDYWSSAAFGFGLGLEQYHQLSWVSSLLTVNLGLLSLHNHVSQFLILKNLFIYLSLYL